MNNEDILIENVVYFKKFNDDLMDLNVKYTEEIEQLNDKILTLETERDVLKSKLSETKADIHYLLENGESIYIRNKYIRGDKDE